MNTVTLESIKPLLRMKEGATVSLYFPTHRHPAGDNIQEDKIRYKNLIRKAKEELENKGYDQDDIRKIGNRLEAIYDQQDFWVQTTEGTAVFANKSETHTYQLPIESDEYVYAGDGVDSAPLLIVCSYDQPFHILALALHEPVLYKGDMNGLERIDIELPPSPEEALNLDEPFSKSRTQRSRVVLGGGGSVGGNNARSSGGHGEGDTREVGNEERDAYFRIIDSKLMDSAEFDTHIPLIITAATESEVAAYRSGSKHQHILANYINGNHTKTKLHDLHQEAWGIISDDIRKVRASEALERFNQLVGTGKASADLDEIMKAAEEGRVDTLLVSMLVVTRDTILDSVAQAEKLVFPEAYAKNLRKIVTTVHDNGGVILGLVQSDLSSVGEVRAIFRY